MERKTVCHTGEHQQIFVLTVAGHRAKRASQSCRTLFKFLFHFPRDTMHSAGADTALLGDCQNALAGLQMTLGFVFRGPGLSSAGRVACPRSMARLNPGH